MRGLGDFLKNEEFGLSYRQALRLQGAGNSGRDTLGPAAEGFDVAVDRFHYSHRHLGPAVVQKAFQMIQ